MMHAITLTYLRSEEEISAHLEAHKQWLMRGIKEGKILFAGPVDNHAGGFILMRGNDKPLIHAFCRKILLSSTTLLMRCCSVLNPCYALRVPVAWADKAKFI
jgi:hypothetical protein